MPRTPLDDVLRYLRRSFAAHAARDLTDGELLERFVNQREEAAVTILVQRHGPMVLSVCRRVLGDSHGAEDAFQATFMVLVRRASSIGRREPLGGWLYGVAQRIALKARAQAAARRQRERRFAPMPCADSLDDVTWRELRSVLDEEIGRLPEKYRTPIVLCYFEGKSYDQVARELGLAKSSLGNRVVRGRELLRQQLVRRGITLSAGALATALCEKVAAAPLSALLTIKTVKAAALVAAGKSLAGGGISAGALVLAEEAMLGVAGINGKLVFMVLALGLAVGGAGWAGYKGLAETAQPAPAASTQLPAPKKQAEVPAKYDQRIAMDQYGDPLPEGAVARLGTARFRHGLFIRALAFAPGGKILASAGNVGDGVCLWDAATGRLRHRLSDYRYGSSVGFSPDGKVLTTVGPYGYTFLIDVATGKELHRFQSPAGARPIVAFSTDGRTVAIAEPERGSDMILWDIATGKKLRTLKGHADRVQSIAFAHDGRILASGGQDNTVIVWDVATGQEIRHLTEHTKTAWSLAFAPESKVLASSEANGLIRLWDVGMGKLLHVLSADPGSPTCTFSPDGKLLASGANDGTIRLWDPHTATELRRWSAGETSIESLALAFSPDGKVLASAAGCAIRLWETRTGEEIIPIAGHTGGIRSLVFSADGKTLFSSGWDSKVVDWDVAAGKARGQFFSGRIGPGHDYWIPFDLSPDGTLAALVGRKAVLGSTPPLHLVNTGTGQETHALSANREVLLSSRFSPDGKLVALASVAGIRLWDVATGREVRHLQGNQSRIDAVAFSPDSKLLACGFGLPDMTIRLWEVATGKEVQRWDSRHKGHGTTAIIFSPDGKSIATGDGMEVGVWAAETGRELARFRAYLNDAAVFSPSGRVLAFSDISDKGSNEKDSARNCMIELREVRSGEKIQRIDTPQGRVRTLAFSRDGRSLASGGNDSTIIIWDLTGRAQDDKRKSAALTAKHLQELWVDLAGDAAIAERALWTLTQASQESMPCLKAWLAPVAPADAQQVANLLADLGSDQYTERGQAAIALQHLGEAAEGAIRKALDSKPSLEVHRRLERILEHDKHGKEKEVVRRLRAIEAVEHIGTREARQLLASLAKGAPNPAVAQAAEAACQRLSRR
jgi:RNA polymerase sigma factor (sigma-70 family)